MWNSHTSSVPPAAYRYSQGSQPNVAVAHASRIPAAADAVSEPTDE